MLDRTEPAPAERTSATGSSGGAPSSTTSRWSDVVRRPVGWVFRRWPTLVAVALVGPDLVAGGSGDTGGAAEMFGQILPMLALVYLLMAKIGRRKLTWPVVALLVAVVLIIRISGVLAPSSVLVGASLLMLVWVTFDGRLRRSRILRIEAVGVVLFCSVAVVGLVIDPEIGTYVIAAGWLLHGVWDFVHLWRDRVVSRTFAELCGVVDVLIAIQLVMI